MNLQFILTCDEQQRPMGFEVYPSNKSMQGVSHGFSHKYCRDMFKEEGDLMGFDNDAYYFWKYRRFDFN